MATVIGIMGESGAGKTTSARTLDPKTTYYLDCDKKGLSWKGWKSQYAESKTNYARTSNVDFIKRQLRYISESLPHIKTIIIDTVNGIMVDEEMKRMKEKGYDKWQDLAIFVYELISGSHYLRGDLVVVFMFHVHDEHDDNGNHFYRILTNGRKLDKIKLESKLTTLLFSRCIDGKYCFETQSRNSTAKSPMGLFENTEIPNDLNAVVQAITKYEKGE